MPTYAVNKQANFDYEILDKYEAGIVLEGHEVKSVRQGQINLKGAFATFKQGELYLTNAHISPYKYAGHLKDYDPTRPRKLLITKKEIKRLLGKLQQKGFERNRHSDGIYYIGLQVKPSVEERLDNAILDLIDN